MPAPFLTVWYNTRCPVCDAGTTRHFYDRFADLLFAWNRRKGRW